MECLYIVACPTSIVIFRAFYLVRPLYRGEFGGWPSSGPFSCGVPNPPGPQKGTHLGKDNGHKGGKHNRRKTKKNVLKSWSMDKVRHLS